MLKNNQNAKLWNLLLLLHTSNLFFSFGAKFQELLPTLRELFSKKSDFTKLKLSEAEIKKLQDPDWSVVEKDLLWAEKEDHHIITINDADYPALLQEIPNPPLVLFVMGNLGLLKFSQIAMVGSRNPTPFGIENAHSFAEALASTGLVITSGFAAGIDAASHRGAIESFGKTIAVMGTGLNERYPMYHTPLAEKIVAAGGVLLSEFPLDAKAKAWHFPLRNRIISGLARGTLVVEATLRSGSLITARLAAEQGREVFAIPGSIHNPLARGCHYLIRQGAKLVEEPLDILEEFPEFIANIKEQVVRSKSVEKKNKLDYEYQKLLDCTDFDITTADVLAARINLPVSRVSIMLVELELQGLIKRVKNGYIKPMKNQEIV